MSILTKMDNLKVLYLKGNGIIKHVKHYRKTLINNIKILTYLDDRPVDEADRMGSEAFFRGGLDEERKVREECRRMKDTGYKIRKMEEDKEKVSFEERKEKAIKSLKNEYLKKKEFLEKKKRKLLKEYQEISKNDLAAKKDKTREIIAVDYQMKENEKLKIEEEQKIIFSMAKREKYNIYSIFEYQEWMDPILINIVVENMFDFATALKLIQIELKNRNIQNYELFNEFELRSRWNDIELKNFRKILNEKEKIEKPENEDFINKEISKVKNAEKDKRINLSTILEANIDESIFLNAVEVTNHKEKETVKFNENIESKNKIIEENKNKNVNFGENGNKLSNEEESINFSDLD